MNRNAKTYYPARTFDDDLAGLVKLAQESKWSFSNVDLKQLIKDVGEQRVERAEHDALEVRFNHAHETFGVNQQGRHQRFSTLLETARGAFGRDKAVMAQLDTFKRSTRRSAKAAPPTGSTGGNGSGVTGGNGATDSPAASLSAHAK